MEGVTVFSRLSGLAPNNAKSSCFFGNVNDESRTAILSTIGFHWGALSICYPGLPLIRRLKTNDCSPLLDRFASLIENWAFGGRLQLIKIVLGYWCMFLFLPKSILKKLNAIMFKYLRGGFYKPNGKCQYKVKWEDCCKPKNEGVLGLRNIFEWNFSSLLFQLWCLSQHTDLKSLWIAWFWRVLIKGKGLWTIKIPYKCPWAAHKIFNCGEFTLSKIQYPIGINSEHPFWHDP